MEVYISKCNNNILNLAKTKQAIVSYFLHKQKLWTNIISIFYTSYLETNPIRDRVKLFKHYEVEPRHFKVLIDTEIIYASIANWKTKRPMGQISHLRNISQQKTLFIMKLWWCCTSGLGKMHYYLPLEKVCSLILFTQRCFVLSLVEIRTVHGYGEEYKNVKSVQTDGWTDRWWSTYDQKR